MNDGAVVAPAAAAAGADTIRCGNCATPLLGRYCHACGQDTVPPDTAWQAWGDQWAKLWRTLFALVLRPGLLTREHLQGGRVRYVAPLTLYLNTVAVFFLCSALFEFRLSAFLASTRIPGLADLVARRAGADHLSSSAFLQIADRHFQTIYTLCLSAVSVAGYAVIARVLFHRHWRGWRGPITFALHFMAFAFIVYMPLAALAIKIARGNGALAAPVGNAMVLCAALIVASWFALAIHRLFGDRWPWAAAKGVAITLLGIPINTLMWEAAIYLTLWTT